MGPQPLRRVIRPCENADAMPHPAWICDLGRAEYEPTAALQRRLRAAREAGDLPDTLLALEHDPVITTGHRTEPHEVAYARTTDVPVVPTERGGKATYHGPGQLVAYPIFDLSAHGSDVKAFVRALEQALIDTIAAFGLPTTRRDGYPGVWVADRAREPARKVASIGIRVTRWVSFHGVALNVDCDIAPFGWFTPCGIPDVIMTSMQRELGADACPSLSAVRQQLVVQVACHFGLAPTYIDAALLHQLAATPRVDLPDMVAESHCTLAGAR